MRRRSVLAAAAAFAWPFGVYAQQKAMPVIGYLGSGSPGPSAPFVAALHQGLVESGEHRVGPAPLADRRRDLRHQPLDARPSTAAEAQRSAGRRSGRSIKHGYVEGQNVAIEYRYAEGRNDRLPALAADLVGRKVDVIVATGGSAPRAAKAASPTIPIVFTIGGDPVAAGVRGSDEFEAAFAEMASKRIGALVVIDDAILIANAQTLALLTLQQRLPSSGWRDYAVAGGLFSYGVSFTDMFRRAANFVDKILKGAKPSDLPVERASKFKTVVNLKTAKALGIEVSTSLLLRADEVIE